MGRGVKRKGREKGGRGGKRKGPPCSQPPLLKNPGYGPARRPTPKKSLGATVKQQTLEGHMVCSKADIMFHIRGPATENDLSVVTQTSLDTRHEIINEHVYSPQKADVE